MNELENVNILINRYFLTLELKFNIDCIWIP